MKHEYSSFISEIRNLNEIVVKSSSDQNNLLSANAVLQEFLPNFPYFNTDNDEPIVYPPNITSYTKKSNDKKVQKQKKLTSIKAHIGILNNEPQFD